MNLQTQYIEETGKQCTESISGFLAYTDDYVEWLENKLQNSCTVK